MSDAIDRDAVTRLIDESATISDDEARVRHIANGVLMLPAVPPSPAERLARAAVRREAASAALAFEKPETQVEWNDALAEFREAMEAYRAAPPAAEPAAEPAPCGTCAGHLTVSDEITHTDYDHDTGESREWGEMVSRPCPSCRLGGAA